MNREGIDTRLLITEAPFQEMHPSGEIIFSLGPTEEKYRILHTDHEDYKIVKSEFLPINTG